MKQSLPILAIGGVAVAVTGMLVALSSSDANDQRPTASGKAIATTRGAEPADGDALLRDAAERICGHPIIEARVRQQVDLFGQRLIGAGLYQQQGAGVDALLRVELRTTAADQTTSLLQVCDGKFFWTHVDLGGTASLRRADVRRIRSARARSWAARGAEPGAPRPLSLGGLPKLLAGLSADFRFDAPRSVEVGGLAAWLVEGHWNERRLAQLLPDQADAIRAGQAADTSKLPAHVPDRVLVVLGRDDRFPYRIEYRRAGRRRGEGSTSAEADERILLVMELYEIRLSGDIDRRQFQYQPGELPVADETERYLPAGH